MDQQLTEMAVISFGDEKAYIEIAARQEDTALYYDNKKDDTDKNGMLQINASQMDNLVNVGKSILEKLGQFNADQTEVSFGIKVSGEGAFFCFAKAGAEAQFNIKLTWKKRDSE